MNKIPAMKDCKIKMMKRSKEEVIWRAIFYIEGNDYLLTLPVHLKNEVWIAGKVEWKNDNGIWKDVNVTNHPHFKDHLFLQIVKAIKENSKYKLQIQAFNKAKFSTAGFEPVKYHSFKVEMKE